MSAINGDKRRAGRQRSHKLRMRVKIRALRATLKVRPSKPVGQA